MKHIALFLLCLPLACCQISREPDPLQVFLFGGEIVPPDEAEANSQWALHSQYHDEGLGRAMNR